MQKIEPLQFGKYYHIYNRGINGENLFIEPDNYVYFMKLYENHINPIAETYAWCLMKNHFHFLVKIKEELDINPLKIKLAHQAFSNLFNAYTKAFNKKYNRNSSLFQRSFKRKIIDNEDYLKKLILYINTNPVKHKICSNAMDYEWSSYLTHVSMKQRIIKTERIIEYFGDLDNLIQIHNRFSISNSIEIDF